MSINDDLSTPFEPLRLTPEQVQSRIDRMAQYRLPLPQKIEPFEGMMNTDLLSPHPSFNRQGVPVVRQLKPSSCATCQYHHGQAHGGSHLVCAVHPYGPKGDSCEDWEECGEVVPDPDSPVPGSIESRLISIGVTFQEAAAAIETLGNVYNDQRQSLQNAIEQLAAIDWAAVKRGRLLIEQERQQRWATDPLRIGDKLRELRSQTFYMLGNLANIGSNALSELADWLWDLS